MRRQDDEGERDRPRDHHRQHGMASQAPPPAIDGQADALQGAPGDEPPGCAVPQPGEGHRDDEVERGAQVAVARAPQREVQVVPQPGAQGDVPATPELGHRQRTVGPLEVARQPDAQETRGAARQVRVAGEVEVQLEGPRRRDGQERQRAVAVQVHEAVADDGRKLVGDRAFLRRPVTSSGMAMWTSAKPKVRRNRSWGRNS